MKLDFNIELVCLDSGSSFARMPNHAMRPHEWGTQISNDRRTPSNTSCTTSNETNCQPERRCECYYSSDVQFQKSPPSFFETLHAAFSSGIPSNKINRNCTPPTSITRLYASSCERKRLENCLWKHAFEMCGTPSS